MLPRTTMTIAEIASSEIHSTTIADELIQIDKNIRDLEQQRPPIVEEVDKLNIEVLTRKIKTLNDEKPFHEDELAKLQPVLTAQLSIISKKTNLIARLAQSISAIERRLKSIDSLQKANKKLEQTNAQLQSTVDSNIEKIKQENLRDSIRIFVPEYRQQEELNNQQQTRIHQNSARIRQNQDQSRTPHYAQQRRVNPTPPFEPYYANPPITLGLNLLPSQASCLGEDNERLQKTILANQQTLLNNHKEINKLLVTHEIHPVTNLPSTLEELKNSKTTLVAELAPLETQRDQLNSKITSHQAPLTLLKTSISELNTLKQTHKPDSSLSSLQSDKLDEQFVTASNNLSDLDKRIVGIQSEKTQLQQTQTDIQNNTLIHAPGSLVGSFAHTMITQFKEFENKHPTNQPRMIRLCLWEVENNILALINIGTIETARESYYKLYGMLATFQDYIDSEESNNVEITKAFQQTLDAIQLSASINSRRPLFIDANECKQLYKSSVNPAHPMTIGALNVVEKQSYDKAYTDLLTSYEALKKSGWEYRMCRQTNTILLEVKKAIDSNPSKCQDQYKFFTTVLSKVNQVIKKNALENATIEDRAASLNDLALLTKFITLGVPSFAKKFWGAVLMFVGTLLTAASVSAKVLTFGIAAPVAIAGIAVGSTLFLSGAGLFSSGMRKGLSKNLKGLHDDLSNPDRLAREAFSAAPPAYQR